MTPASACRLVVFGYGNPSRGDDGLGPEILHRLGELKVGRPGWGGMTLVEDFQLQVEHAVDLEGHDLVLFIDASVSCVHPYAFTRLVPERDKSYTSHAMSPAAVLHVFQEINAAPAPPAFLLSVRGECFELGRSLSQAARGHADAAYAFAVGLCERPSIAEWERALTPAASVGNPG